jgi:hypothetical protein
MNLTKGERFRLSDIVKILSSMEGKGYKITKVDYQDRVNLPKFLTLAELLEFHSQPNVGCEEKDSRTATFTIVMETERTGGRPVGEGSE